MVTGALTSVLAAAAGDAADEAEELVLELRGELGHGAVEGRASCGGTKKGSSPESSSWRCCWPRTLYLYTATMGCRGNFPASVDSGPVVGYITSVLQLGRYLSNFWFCPEAPNSAGKLV